MVSHEQRIGIAKAVADAIRRKHKDVVFIAVYGSVGRNEDDEHSDIELIVLTKAKKKEINQLIFRSIPMEINMQTKKEALAELRTAKMMWPAYAGKYLLAKSLYAKGNIIDEMRKAAKTIKKKDFNFAAAVALAVMKEQVGKVKNAAKRKKLPKCVEAATWLTYTATLFVGLMNKKYYRRHGINSIEEARTFSKLPENYTALMEKLHVNKNLSVLANAADELYNNCVDIAKRNGVKERYFWNIEDAIKQS